MNPGRQNMATNNCFPQTKAKTKQAKRQKFGTYLQKQRKLKGK